MTNDEFKRRYEHGERDFAGSSLDGCNLPLFQYSDCNFSGASFRNSWLYEVTFANCDFSHARLAHARLKRCQFLHTQLEGASFYLGRIEDLLLSECSAIGTTFKSASIEHSRFIFSDMQNVDLTGAVFRRTILADAYLAGARVGENIFVDCRIPSLIQAGGVRFEGPINIDWLTVCQNVNASGLEDFLLRGGSPEVFVRYAVDCARSMDPAMLFSLMRSTFISYGGPDTEFAGRLRDALLRNGVRTFLFASDAVPGEPLHRVMRQAVNAHDRVILICSEASLNRSGVLNELELALAKEARDGGATYLIPIILDDYLFRWNPDRTDVAQALRDRVVSDFREAASNEVAFTTGITRLLKALRV